LINISGNDWHDISSASLKMSFGVGKDKLRKGANITILKSDFSL
jgi:hypothetical protein